MKSWAWLIGAAVLLTTTSPGLAQGLQPTDLQLLTAIAELDRASASSSIWPGFHPERAPLALVDKGRVTLLLHHPSPPHGFVPLVGAPAGLRGVYVRWGATKDLDGASEFWAMLGGRKVTVLPFPYLFYDRQLTAGKLTAPVFTNYAQDTFADFGAFKQLANQRSYPATDPENTALAGVEASALSAALLSSDAVKARAFARMAVAVRRARHARLDAAVRRYESLIETVEGCLRYVENETARYAPAKAGVLAFRDHPQAVRNLASRLTAPLGNEATRRVHFAATGAAMGVLLDRFDQPNWKGTVASGTPLGETFDRTAKLLDVQQADVLASAKQAFHYDQLLATAKDTWSQYPASYKEFLARPGIKWVITGLLPVKEGAPGERMRIDSTETPLEIDAQTLLAYKVKHFEYARGPVILSVGDTPFLMQSKSLSWPLETLTLMIDDPSTTVKADGQNVALSDGTYPFKTSLIVEAGPLFLRAYQGTLTVAGKTVSLKIDR